MRFVLPVLITFCLACCLACGGPSPLDAGADADAPDGATATDAALDGRVPRVDGGPPAPITDRDGDGVDDAEDAFPDDPAEWLDRDGDGVGNFADLDEDGDGVPDEEDAFPFDADRSTWPVVSVIESGGLYPEPVDVGPLPFQVASSLDRDRDLDAFRFTGVEGQLVTAVLEADGAADGAATLSVAELVGDDPIPVALLPAPELLAPDVVAVAAFRIDRAATYEVLVESRVGAGTYRLTVAPDADLDGARDALEEALGMRAGDADPDRDGVPDGVELSASRDPFDLDGDGLPGWYDDDADGDGFADGAEGAADPDRDGAPDFADLDADGDGAPDADAFSAGRAPPDLDLDGAPDYRDVDDDGDGVPDLDDAEPAAPLVEADPFSDATRVLVTGVEGDLPGAPSTPGLVVAGEVLTIRGEGFAASGNLALLRRGDGSIERVPATRIADGVLQATFTRAGEGEISVQAGPTSDLTSNQVPLAVVHPDAPLLLPTSDRAMTNAGVSVPGLRTAGITHVELDGVRIDFNHPPAADRLDFWGADWMEDGVLRAFAGDLASNPVALRFTRGVSTSIQVPAGAPFDAFDLRLSADSRDLLPHSSLIPVSTREVDVVCALHPDPGDGRPALVFQWVTFEGDSSARPMGPTSTAVAQVLLANQALDRVALASMADLLGRVEALPEIAALASRIEAGLAASASFFRDPGPAYAADFERALAAAEAEIRAGLGDASLTPLAGQRAEITPAEQFDVSVRQRAGTGHVDVENDTAFLLSAEVRDLADRPLQRHIDGPFDTNIIGAQRGALLLFDASTAALSAPGYRSATVEIVTPGVFAPQPTGARARRAQDLVRLRTVLDRVLLPTLADLVGHSRALQSRAFRRALITLLLQQSLDTITEFRTAMDAGEPRRAIGILVNLFLRDLDSAGPITQLFARALAVGAAAAVVSQIAGRIAAKAVPVLGQLDALLSAAGAISNAVNLGKVLADLSDTPGMLEFDVDFGFEATAVRPLDVEKAHRDTLFRVIGAGLASDAGPTEVTFHDEGGGFDPVTVTPTRVAPDGTSLHAVLPAASLARAIGPIRLEVRAGDDRGDVPMNVQVENGVRIDALDPPMGGPNQAVWIRGRGFAEDRRLLRVRFVESGVLGTDPRSFEAPVLSASRSELLVLTPARIEADTGWDVIVDVGPPGGRVSSEPRLFNVQFPSLIGTWDVTYRHHSCRPISCDQCHWEEWQVRYEITTMPDAVSARGDAFTVSPIRFTGPGVLYCPARFELYTNPLDPKFGFVESGDAGCFAPHVGQRFEGRFSAIGDVYQGRTVGPAICPTHVPSRITAVRRL